MSSKATMSAIAEAASVSISTVSRVVGGGEGISQKTIDKVLKAADRLGYRPKGMPGSRPSRQQSSLKIGLMHWANDQHPPRHAIQQHLHQQFIMELWSAIHAAGHVFCLDYRNADNPGDSSALMAPWAVDGVIIKGAITPGSISEIPPGLPALFLRMPPGLGGGLSSVNCNYTAGITDCIHYLHELGHRRIAMFSLAHMRLNDLEKIIAYQQTLAALGLDGESYLQVPSLDRFDDDRGACGFAVDQWMGRVAPPTAIISSESFCQQISEHLEARGLSIPQDVSLIDAVTGASRHESFRQHATRLQMPVKQMCQVALTHLLQHIENPDSPPQNIQLQMSLIAGETTGPAKIK